MHANPLLLVHFILWLWCFRCTRCLSAGSSVSGCLTHKHIVSRRHSVPLVAALAILSTTRALCHNSRAQMKRIERWMGDRCALSRVCCRASEVNFNWLPFSGTRHTCEATPRRRARTMCVSANRRPLHQRTHKPPHTWCCWWRMCIYAEGSEFCAESALSVRSTTSIFVVVAVFYLLCESRTKHSLLHGQSHAN